MDIITFNGQSFRDYGCYFDGSQLFSTPSKDISFYSVPGKNGDLSISNDRYLNITRNINCFIRENFTSNFPSLMNYLLSQDGYGRLESTKEPDIFMMAQFVDSIEPTTGAFLKYGSFTLTFNFKPQKWLKSGENEITVTTGATLVNPSLMPSKPLISVVGTGSITIGTSVLALATNTSTTLIDCEMEDAYEGTINRNPNLTVTNGFPTLVSGNNSITISGFTSVKITPRWWRL